jgi:D-3-phosphoglycerate dehydrogenase
MGHSAHDAWNAVTQISEVVKPASISREDFLKECRSGKFEGVVAAYRTFHSFGITGLIDKELVDALPNSLKYFASCGTCILLCFNILQCDDTNMPQIGAGYDQVDIDACSARNPPLLVSNVPTAVDDATADVNMFLILGALRNLNSGMHSLREGKWRGKSALGHDPQGKTLGILGMGGIGRNLKKKAEAFGMKVIYHNRRQLSEELSGGAQYVTFDELLSTSDVVSLNLPLNVSETDYIGEEFPGTKVSVC